MKFITHVPRPTLVTPDNVEEAVRDCWDVDILLGVDTETLGKKYLKMDDQIVCMGLCPRQGVRYYIPRSLIRFFQPLLESPITKALTNVKFDAHRFANAGISLGGRWVDSVVLDFLYDEDTRENNHGLKPTARDYLGLPLREFKELFGGENMAELAKTPSHPKYDLFVDYASLDPWATREVCLHLMGELRDVVKWPDDERETLMYHYWVDEEPQLKVTYAMERRGILVDKDRIEEIRAELQGEIDEYERNINRAVGRPFNPNSGPQKIQLLFVDLGLTPLSYTDTGQPQVDAKTLKHFANEGVEICELLLAHAKAKKLQGTYCDGLLKHVAKDGRIHTSYSVTKITGRLGSSDPNLQNIPGKYKDRYGIRKAFIAPDGMVFIVTDYAQLEMRILADLSGDEGMIQAILGGLDMHSFTAAKMVNWPYDDFKALITSGKAAEGEDRGMTDEEAWADLQRARAKAIGFGIVYGKTKYGLARDWNCSVAEAQGFIDMYLDTFPGVRAYVADTIRSAKKRGYVQTMRGRFRRTSKINSRKFGARTERQAINSRIQGSAADIVKAAMIHIENDARLKEMGCRLLHQVHDELLCECPEEHAAEAAEIIQEYMEHPWAEGLAVPLIAEPGIAHTWGDAK